MKHTVKLLILSALTFATAQAVMPVSDNAELFVTASAALQFDDNVYLDDKNTQEDMIFSFTPGIELPFGKGSATSGNLYFREEFRIFNDQSDQDVNLASVGANSAYSNGLTKLNFNASFAQLAQNLLGTNLVGDIANRDVSNLLAKSEFGLSEKAVLALGLVYDVTDYKDVGFVDSNITSIPLDVYYQYSPKLDMSIGYQYRVTNLGGTGDDSSDNYFNIGARGEFTPKLSGQVRFGYTNRAYDRTDSEDLFTTGMKLGYAYSEATTINFTLDNDFGSAGNGASTKNFSWGLNGSSRLTQQWLLNASILFRTIEYPKNTDDFIEGQIVATYEYNPIVNFSASLTYRNNDAEIAGGDFENTVFSIGANIRY